MLVLLLMLLVFTLPDNFLKSFDPLVDISHDNQLTN